MDDPEVLGRQPGFSGEVVLRRRGSGDEAVEELIVSGAFAMDSVDTVSERELADLAIPPGHPADRVLVGGLGLGYTVHQLLQHPVGQVDVVEIEAPLVAWARAGVTQMLGGVAADPRVSLHVCDIKAVLLGEAAAPTGPWNAIVLDVDNGPNFLIHIANATLYDPELLTAAYQQLRPGGILAVWSQSRAPDFHHVCRSVSADAVEHVVVTRRGQRELEYAIYTLVRPLSDPGSGSARMGQ